MREQLIALFTLPLLVLPLLAFADISGRVVAVTSGDTITVLDGYNIEHTVRLVGIDAPERGQPFGPESTERLASMVSGKQVFVAATRNDRYGHILGKVWVQPGDCPACGKTLDANYAQILAGMARWSRHSAEEQSAEDRGRYESAEDEARAREWGLWVKQEDL